MNFNRASRLAATALALIGLARCTSSEPPADDLSLSTHRTRAGQEPTSSPTPFAPSSATSTPRSAPPASIPSGANPNSPSTQVSPSPINSTAMASAPIEVPVVPHRIIHVTARTGSEGRQLFEPDVIVIYAGQQVEVILDNHENAASGISHNWVLIKPGSESAVTALGKDAGVDPDAVTYSPSILAATKTVRPAGSGIVDFSAPEIPGDYPFISLVGDQFKMMRGTLRVKTIR